MDLKKYIASIPGFPKEGIIFRDVTPILETPEAMHYVVDAFTEFAKQTSVLFAKNKSFKHKTLLLCQQKENT